MNVSVILVLTMPPLTNNMLASMRVNTVQSLSLSSNTPLSSTHRQLLTEGYTRLSVPGVFDDSQIRDVWSRYSSDEPMFGGLESFVFVLNILTRVTSDKMCNKDRADA